jgi:hypothetical protein
MRFKLLKHLSTLLTKPLSLSTVCLHLKKAEMKAVVKAKCPCLTARHCKAHLDFAYAYKD